MRLDAEVPSLFSGVVFLAPGCSSRVPRLTAALLAVGVVWNVPGAKDLVTIHRATYGTGIRRSRGSGS